ncbi:unnamed protein product, partial [Pylaiella littoralis]
MVGHIPGREASKSISNMKPRPQPRHQPRGFEVKLRLAGKLMDEQCEQMEKTTSEKTAHLPPVRMATPATTTLFQRCPGRPRLSHRLVAATVHGARDYCGRHVFPNGWGGGEWPGT